MSGKATKELASKKDSSVTDDKTVRDTEEDVRIMQQSWVVKLHPDSGQVGQLPTAVRTCSGVDVIEGVSFRRWLFRCIIRKNSKIWQHGTIHTAARA